MPLLAISDAQENAYNFNETINRLFNVQINPNIEALSQVIGINTIQENADRLFQTVDLNLNAEIIPFDLLSQSGFFKVKSATFFAV